MTAQSTPVKMKALIDLMFSEIKSAKILCQPGEAQMGSHISVLKLVVEDAFDSVGGEWFGEIVFYPKIFGSLNVGRIVR